MDSSFSFRHIPNVSTLTLLTKNKNAQRCSHKFLYSPNGEDAVGKKVKLDKIAADNLICLIAETGFTGK